MADGMKARAESNGRRVKVVLTADFHGTVDLDRDEAEALADQIKAEAKKIPEARPATWVGGNNGRAVLVANGNDYPGDKGPVYIQLGGPGTSSSGVSLPLVSAKLLISQLQTLVDEAEGEKPEQAAATSFRLFDTWSSIGGHIEAGLLYLDACDREGERTVVRFDKAKARALASYISGIAQQLP